MPGRPACARIFAPLRRRAAARTRRVNRRREYLKGGGRIPNGRWAQSRLLLRPPPFVGETRAPAGPSRSEGNTLPALVATTQRKPGPGRPRQASTARAPQPSGSGPPIFHPSPHTCVYSAGSVAKKSVLTQCVCVLYWLGGKSAEAGNLLATPKPPRLRRTRPGPRCCRGHPRGRQSRAFCTFPGLQFRWTQPDLTIFFRFVLKPKDRPTLDSALLAAPLSRRGLSVPRFKGSPAQFRVKPCTPQNAGVAGRRDGILPQPFPPHPEKPSFPRPEPPPPLAPSRLGQRDRNPRAPQPLHEGSPGNSPASAARLGRSCVAVL